MDHLGKHLEEFQVAAIASSNRWYDDAAAAITATISTTADITDVCWLIPDKEGQELNERDGRVSKKKATDELTLAWHI